MDIVLYFVAVAILIVLIVSAVKVRGKAEEDNHEARQEVAAQVVGRQQMAEEGANRLRRRRNLNRMMANRMANSAQREAADNDSPVEVEEEYEEAEQQSQATGKIGAKKQKKLEEKQAKRAQREAELEEREERKRTQELKEEERRMEDKKERILEQRQEEEELRAKEEQEKREEEEYLCLKQSFVVEEQGEADELTEQESQNLLQEFIQHIKDCKVVLLEDLASHFGLRTQDAISRLQDILADGSITGVIDDRGKFIFITPEEMNAVAQFIRQRGRVSITDLAQASNSLINLIPEIHNTA